MTAIKDNRIHLDVDPKKLQTWEIMIFEEDSPKINDLLMVFSRYAANGDGLVSANLPNDPLDELTQEQVKEIKSSTAYKALRRFTLPALRQAARSFAEQAGEAFNDPN